MHFRFVILFPNNENIILCIMSYQEGDAFIIFTLCYVVLLPSDKLSHVFEVFWF